MKISGKTLEVRKACPSSYLSDEKKIKILILNNATLFSLDFQFFISAYFLIRKQI